MAEITTMGELLMEIMRPGVDEDFYRPGLFKGPYPSGSSAIFIDAATRLGRSGKIIGGVGADDFGRCIVDRLTAHGVDCSDVTRSTELSTAVAFNTRFSNGDRSFIFHIGNAAAGTAKAPDGVPPEDARYFHLMGSALCHNKHFTAEVTRCIQAFASRGVKLSFDPNLRPELLKGKNAANLLGQIAERCSVLLPGEDELLALAGEASADRAAEKMFRSDVLEIIAMKRGSKGSRIYTRSGSFDMGVCAIEPLDATGAGDCFDAGFLCGLLEGLPLHECARLASAAAALNTAAFGPMEGDISRENAEILMRKTWNTGLNRPC